MKDRNESIGYNIKQSDLIKIRHMIINSKLSDIIIIKYELAQ